MSENLNLQQPARTETSVVATCRHCGSEVYLETLIEELGVPVERITSGTARQTVDSDGNQTGPVVPFCNCKEA